MVLRKERDPLPEDSDAETEHLASSNEMGKFLAEALEIKPVHFYFYI